MPKLEPTKKSVALGGILAALLPAMYMFSYPLRGLVPGSTGDTGHYQFVTKRWFWDQVAKGEWPLWNDALFTGFFQLASPVHEIFSPLTTPFYWVLPNVWPMLATLILAALLAGLGAYFFAGLFQLPVAARVTLAWAYAFSGCFLSHIDRSATLAGMALYPWLGFAIVSLVRDPRWGRVAFIAVVLSVIVQQSDWIAAAVFTISGIVYLVITPSGARAKLRALFSVLVALVITGAISAVLLLPVRENLPWSMRAEKLSLEMINHWSLHPMRLLQIACGELWGNPYEGSFWGGSVADPTDPVRFWLHSVYAGAAGVILLGWGIAVAPRRKNWLILAGGIILLYLVSLGSYFPLHRWLYEHSTIYSRLRYPEKFFAFAIVLSFIFTILALKALFQSGAKRWACFWYAVAAIHLLAPLVAWVLVPKSSAPQQKLISSLLHSSLITHILFTFAAICLAEVARRFTPRWIGWCLAVFVAADLIAFAPGHVLVYKESFSEPLPVLKTPELTDPQAGRILHDDLLRNNRIADPRQILSYNWGELSGLHFVGGYEVIRPDRFVDDTRSAIILKNINVWAPVLNIGFVVAPLNPTQAWVVRWNSAHLLSLSYHDDDRNLLVFKVMRTPATFAWAHQATFVEDANAAKKAVLARAGALEPIVIEQNEVFLKGHNVEGNDFATPTQPNANSADDLKVIRSSKSANAREWELQAGSAGYFVVRENFHPNWHPYLDGAPIPVARAEYFNYAVKIPAGTHHLAMRFESRAWELGWRISLVGLTALLVLLTVPRIRRSKVMAN